MRAVGRRTTDGRPELEPRDPGPIETIDIHPETSDPVPAYGRRSGGLVTAAVALKGARPEAFLRLFEGEPRGFWARGERWVAHAGALATLTVSAGEGDRFARMRAEAVAWRARPRSPLPAGADPRTVGRLRFYGGFSFREDHQPSGFWETFPPALFLLPSVELEGDARTATLRARATAAPGVDPEDVHATLREVLTRVAERCKDDALPEATAGAERGARVPAERTEMGRVTWDDAVAEALEWVRSGRVSKVVLARTMDVTTAVPLDPVRVVGHLWNQNPATHVFLFEPRPGRPLVGAAPETVATLRRGVFHATAVAGSIARGDTDEEQRLLATRLLRSDKDREEHRIAVEDMVARLRPLADGVRAGEEPHVLTLSRIQHLETEIRARVPERSVLELLEALHPTPAVCGLPRDAALDFLRGEEPFERGWYAGPVGFFDEDGNGVFAPALRSAVAHGRTWRLFAGAGIVAGSHPLLEWEETGMKFEPVLRAFEASGASVAEVGGEPPGARVAPSEAPRREP